VATMTEQCEWNSEEFSNKGEVGGADGSACETEAWTLDGCRIAALLGAPRSKEWPELLHMQHWRDNTEDVVVRLSKNPVGPSHLAHYIHGASWALPPSHPTSRGTALQLTWNAAPLGESAVHPVCLITRGFVHPLWAKQA